MAYEFGKFLYTPEVTLYYEVLGTSNSVPLIVLNGGPGRSFKNLLFSPVWHQLAQARPVIFYDQRGTGRSTPLQTHISCTLADQVVDLDAVRTHLGYEQIDLLGHSWGGYLAMAYTARHGQRVRRLVLVDSAAPRIQETVMLFDQVFPEAIGRHKQIRAAMRPDDHETLQATERIYFSMLCHTLDKRDAYLAMADATVLRPDVAQKLIPDLQRLDLTPALSKFRLPTLVITGRFDINVAPSVAYKIHKLIPNSQFVVFERSGHLPFFEEPDTFADVVGRFLAER